MRMKAEDYNAIDYAFRQLSNRKSIADRREAIVIEGKAKNVERRLRWDMLWEAGAAGLLPIAGQATWVCRRLYNEQGLDDNHIDTALRKIMKGN
jgi:hypothetical protein